jgi:CheY-like chemotaxis protein
MNVMTRKLLNPEPGWIPLRCRAKRPAAGPSPGKPMPSYPAPLRDSGAQALELADCMILLAEDNSAIRSLVGDILREQGYSVLEAADGVDALSLSESYPGKIDLLLTDICMPRLDGRELHRRIGIERPETATLFMSGEPDPGLAPEARFLRKPFAPVALLRKVREALNVAEAVPLQARG